MHFDFQCLLLHAAITRSPRVGKTERLEVAISANSPLPALVLARQAVTKRSLCQKQGNRSRILSGITGKSKLNWSRIPSWMQSIESQDSLPPRCGDASGFWSLNIHHREVGKGRAD